MAGSTTESAPDEPDPRRRAQGVGTGPQRTLTGFALCCVEVPNFHPTPG
jgi:hypothetical protein